MLNLLTLPTLLIIVQDFFGHFKDTNIYPPVKYRGRRFYLKCALLLALGAFLFYILYFGFSTWYFAAAAKNNLAAARQSAGRAALAEAGEYLTASADEFRAAASSIAKLGFFGYAPFIKNDYRAAVGILTIGAEVTAGLKSSLEMVEEIFSDFGPPENLNLAGLLPEQKQKILERVGQNAFKIKDIKANLSRAVIAYRALPPKSIFGLEQLVAPYGEQFLDLESKINALLSLLEVFPRLAGYPEPRTYLFLLQNNTELRPSGGFIGAYGIMKLVAGEIKSFFTADSYALDRRASWLKIPPPLPLKKYLTVNYWYLRDANWSPDFAVAASTTADFYHREGGTEKLDGVIAITPDVVSGILKILGPIKVDGQEFTAANFTDALEYRVEVGFAAKGIPRAQRKEIIGVLAEEILGKIYALPLRDWAAVLSSVAGSLEEKHLLLTSSDPEAQKIFDEENWSGRVKDTASDYLLVVDANLNGLKTDPEVSRSVSYSLKKDGEKYLAEVKIRYTHSGARDYKTGRYRDYLRVFTPLGSQLRYFSDGDGDKTTKVDVGDELGKTWFGFFTTVEVGGTEELVFRYELPERVKYQIEQNLYSLLAQKQAGTLANRLTLSLNFDKKIAVAPASGWLENSGKTFRAETDLRVDRIITIGF